MWDLEHRVEIFLEVLAVLSWISACFSCHHDPHHVRNHLLLNLNSDLIMMNHPQDLL